MATETAAVREIDAGTLPDRYARGWHCLGPVKDYLDGEPHGIEAFGTHLVVFADSHGDLHVLDGYCRHMGGNLAQGTIKGDEVACPFHDWRWGGDGKCKLVPYAKRTPRLARTRSWTTDVRSGLLYVWHDHEGNPPPPGVAHPRTSRVRQRRVDRLALELDAHRGLQLPRDHRQRHRHGALLLHPLRSARRTSRTSSKVTSPRSTCTTSAVPTSTIWAPPTVRRTWIRRRHTSARRS